MESRELIDAQFDRAVEIVQSLPKNGPIQTGYEEKLTMYSLYKQATVGNVQSPRPSVWDMLGRAKWDAWAKHRDLDPYEAKWLYVDALLKVLRRYSDKTVAMDLVRELESYSGDPSNLVMSGSMSRSRASTSSSSTASDDHLHQPRAAPPFSSRTLEPRLEEFSADEDEEHDDMPPVPLVPPVYAPSHPTRPQSSMSSRRYRTPTAGSLVLSSPPVPATQPLPEFATESAYAEPSAASHPPAGYPPSGSSYQGYTRASTTDLPAPYTHPSASAYHTSSQQQQQRRPYGAYPGAARPPSRPTLERAIENMQAAVAALTERIDTLEEGALRSTTTLSAQSRTSPRRGVSPGEDGSAGWDVDDMGLWSIVLTPLARAAAMLKFISSFLGRGHGRSPALVILRRLFLDISFLLCVLAVARMVWRRSGMRRREVLAALRGLWWAVVGRKPPRMLVERSV
ncbi:ACBP-domain-containing protein [Wolfiporia cocos MD-104 SS10]|uniref:ACBP-domain-containing protein n=1 Tax=Wolfiporia cocos (strain MD-104) TaxID=742152 RepID=A0A2H3JX69_WOLCO|nr:ACBP-domain-containing protein [Wolfiporia cocos MD-104 SS10]